MPPPLLDSSPFLSGLRGLSILSLGCSWCFQSLGLGQLAFKVPPPLLDSSPFLSGLRGLSLLSLGCSWCFQSLGLVLGRFLHCFLSCRSPCSVSGQGSGKTPLSEVQGCRSLVVVQFRPADALLSPEQGGDQGTLFARNVVQGYARACVSSFYYFRVLYLFYFFSFFFRLNTSRPLAGL